MTVGAVGMAVEKAGVAGDGAGLTERRRGLMMAGGGLPEICDAGGQN